MLFGTQVGWCPDPTPLSLASGNEVVAVTVGLAIETPFLLGLVVTLVEGNWRENGKRVRKR